MSVQRFQTYELTFGPLAAAGGFAQKSFQVLTSDDFWWLKSQAFFYDVNGLQISTLQSPNMDVLLQEGAAQSQFSNQAVAIASIFGTGQIPYILPAPHVIVAGATFNVIVTNRHVATQYSVRLAFSGVHVAAGTSLAETRRALR